MVLSYTPYPTGNKHTISPLLIKPIFSVLAHAEKQFFSKLVLKLIYFSLKWKSSLVYNQMVTKDYLSNPSTKLENQLAKTSLVFFYISPIIDMSNAIKNGTKLQRDS